MSSGIRCKPYTPLDFSRVNRQALKLADLIQARRGELTEILLTYESYEVARDEIDRTLDLLTSLGENKKYFRLRVGSVASFLPRNQPLYALACFVIVPSLMASEVHFRIPHSTRHFFPKMLSLLKIAAQFPNIIISPKTRLEFLKDQSALLVHPKSGANRPRTDVVIFTGTSTHADQLRTIFDDRTLFIANGSGHNPVVVSHNADVAKAVNAVLDLQLYNQGQDCAAPNAILVHKKSLPKFLQLLRNHIQAVNVGHYRDRTCRVGPISDPKELVRIQDLLIEHREWLDSSTSGIVRTADAIVEPTIICKPLCEGGNFSEVFAPVMFIQEYANDAKLKDYFEDERYARNAMYLSIFGTSSYVSSLVDRPIGGKILHDRSSFIRNTHLHAPGIERGVQPYGGYGHGASSISIHGKITSMPTLPQRDIHERIARPILRKRDIASYKRGLRTFTDLHKKDVEKLLRLKPAPGRSQRRVHRGSYAHVDVRSLTHSGTRYTKIAEKNLHYLLNQPNRAYLASIRPADRTLINKLKSLIRRKHSISFDEFNTSLYDIPKKTGATGVLNKTNQRRFFGDIYQLLFGKEFGPQLGPFLWETETDEIDRLFRVQ